MSSLISKYLPWLLVLLLRGGVAADGKKKVPAIIVFGDSSVDTGNNNFIPTIARSNFWPYGRDFADGLPTGRFSNGRLATDFISEAFGLPRTIPAYLDTNLTIDDLATGVSFASASTGLDNATAGIMSVISIAEQLDYFREYKERLRLSKLGEAGAEEVVGEALYIWSIGTNDFLENYYMLGTGRFLQYTVAEFSDFIVDGARRFLSEIHRLGARRVTFAGLSPIGCLPLERTTSLLRGRGGCIEEYNRVAREYNAKLEAMVRGLRAKLPTLKLAYIPVYDAMLDFITNPGKFGLENVGEGCCATGMFEMGFMCNDQAPLTCDDADKFLFWDAFHPTQKINRIMANNTLNDCYQQGVL